MGNTDKFRGLNTVLVDREAVLARVKANRAEHRAKFEEAIEGYKQRVLVLLEEHIERIKNSGPEKVWISLPWPEDHTDDYDRVITQLEFSLDDKLELNEQEFNTYVRDQWGWQVGFQQTYMMYSSS